MDYYSPLRKHSAPPIPERPCTPHSPLYPAKSSVPHSSFVTKPPLASTAVGGGGEGGARGGREFIGGNYVGAGAGGGREFIGGNYIGAGSGGGGGIHGTEGSIGGAGAVVFEGGGDSCSTSEEGSPSPMRRYRPLARSMDATSCTRPPPPPRLPPKRRRAYSVSTSIPGEKYAHFT